MAIRAPDGANKGRGGGGTSKEKIFIRTSFPSRVSFFLQLMTLVVVGGEGHFSMNRNQAGHHSSHLPGIWQNGKK